MAHLLQISTTRLRASDSFQIRNTAGDEVYTINIVSGDPKALEAKDTSDIIPISDEFKAATERLAEALRTIPVVQSVTISDTVLNVNIDSDYTLTTTSPLFNANTANGSLFDFVKQVMDDGTGTVLDTSSPAPEGLEFGSILVSNITITNITHENENFGLPQKNYPYGNRGTYVKTIIDFTAADSFSSIEYKFNYIQNTTPLYGNVSNAQGTFKIDDNLFRSIYDGSIQSFVGNVNVLNPNKPSSWVTGEAEVTFVGGNDFRLTHTYRLPKFVTFDDLNGLDVITPDELKGSNSLKYIAEINLKANIEDPDPSESTSKQNLTNLLPNGNIGYEDEVYKTGQDLYDLDSFSFSNDDNEINSVQTTSGTATLSTTIAGGFVVADDLHLRIYEQNDSLNEKQTFLENINFEEVQVKLDGVTVSSTILQNVSAVIDSGNCILTFDVAANTINGTYTIEAELNNDDVDFQNQTITLKQGETISLADDSTVVMCRYPDGATSEFNFTYHYDTDISASVNDVKSFVEDILINRFCIENTRTDINELTRFEILIRSSVNSTILESLTVSPDQLPYTETRVFNVDTGTTEEFTISIEETSEGIYEFIYPFQIWQNWASIDSVVFTIRARFEQTLIDGTTADFFNEWNSPVFQLGTYDETKNTDLEPQALLKDGYPIYIDEDTGNEINVIKKSGRTEVVFQFEDNNLNDLQNIPNGPYPLVLTPLNSQLGSLTGYLGIVTETNNQADYIRFHNLRTNPVTINGLDNPWEALLGAGGYYAQLTVLDVKTAELRAYLDGEKLQAFYGDVDCLTPSCRLDKINLPIVSWVFETNFDIDADGDFGIEVEGSLNDGDVLWMLKAGTSYTTKEVNIPQGTPLQSGELDGTVQDVMFRTEDFTLIDELNQTVDLTNESIKIVNELDLSLFTKVTNIGFANNPLLTSFVAPDNSEITTFIDLSNNGFTSLDLSPFTNLAGEIYIDNNSSLTSLTTGSSSQPINVFRGENNAYSGVLDLSNLTGLQGIINISSSTHTNISFPTINDPVTTFNMFSCPNVGASVDFSFLKNYSGNFQIYSCPSITSVTLEPTSNIFSNYRIDGCSISGAIDLSILTGGIDNLRFNSNDITSVDLTNVVINGQLSGGFNDLSTLDLSVLTNPLGNLNFRDNPNLQTVTWGSSTNNISEFDFRNCDIQPSISLTGYTNLNNADFIFNNNSNLTSFTLPTTADSVASIDLGGCNLTAFDITPLTGTNNNISIALTNNNLNVTNQETVLSDLKIKGDSGGWTNGTLNLSGNNGTVSLPNTDYDTLQIRGWTITL